MPKQPVRPTVQHKQSGTNVFVVFGFVLLMLSILSAGAVFGYEKYLEGVRDADAVLLEEAKSKIDPNNVEGFIRTRDRFIAAKDILNNHIVFSRYLDTLERLTLQGVRFSSLTYALGKDGNATVTMNGVARTFNALAAESATFAGQKEFKRAIFSGFAVNEKDSTVKFVFTSEIDKSLILFSLPEGTPAVEATLPVATSTPATPSVPAASSTPAAATKTTPAAAPAAQGPTTVPTSVPQAVPQTTTP